MKISLIQPIHANYKIVRKSNGGFFKPAQLTMPYIAACTPPEFDVEIYDEIAAPLDTDKINGDVIGITAVTPFINRAYELSKIFRDRGQTVILGGPHVSSLPGEAINFADAVIIGEGDLLWPKALRDWKNDRLKQIYRNKKPLPLEKLPRPRWDLLDPKKYIVPQVVQASRGCPFSCDFCSLRNIYPTFRTRPVRDVVEEVEKIPNRHIVFWDDNIIGDPQWAKKLFIELAPLKKRWYSQATITMAKSKELVRLAAKSGLGGLFVGLESFSSNSLKGTNKGFNKVEHYKKDIRLFRDNGIAVISGMVFGFDEDTLDSFEANLHGAIEIGLTGVSCSILTPYPGTPLYKRMEKQGRLITRDWSKYSSDDVVFTPKNMTPHQLIKGHNHVGKQFYLYSSMIKRYSKNHFFYNLNPRKMLDNAIEFWGLNLSNHRYFKLFNENTDEENPIFISSTLDRFSQTSD